MLRAIVRVGPAHPAWLAIYLTTWWGEMQWRFDVKDMVRKNLASRYANTHGDTDDHFN